jgi:hypothetical protein
MLNFASLEVFSELRHLARKLFNRLETIIMRPFTNLRPRGFLVKNSLYFFSLPPTLPLFMILSVTLLHTFFLFGYFLSLSFLRLSLFLSSFPKIFLLNILLTEATLSYFNLWIRFCVV